MLLQYNGAIEPGADPENTGEGSDDINTVHELCSIGHNLSHLTKSPPEHELDKEVYGESW